MLRIKHHQNEHDTPCEVVPCGSQSDQILYSYLMAICQGYEMQLALRLVYDINEDLQKLLVRG